MNELRDPGILTTGTKTQLLPAQQIRVNPIAVVSVGLLVGYLLGLVVRFPVEFPSAIRWVGPLPLAAGIVLGAPALRGMIQARTSPNPHRRPTTLLTGGIYRHTRNPMYLGMFLQYTGIALLVSAGWAFLALPVVVVVVDRAVVRREEATLARLFGSTFTEYAARVRRWL